MYSSTYSASVGENKRDEYSSVDLYHVQQWCLEYGNGVTQKGTLYHAFFVSNCRSLNVP